MNKLLEQLRTLPAFISFEKALKENLTGENEYVQVCMPETEGFCEEDDDGGNVSGYYYKKSEYEAVQEGIDELIDNEKELTFDEFVRNSIDEEVIELARALIKELRKEGSV